MTYFVFRGNRWYFPPLTRSFARATNFVSKSTLWSHSSTYWPHVCRWCSSRGPVNSISMHSTSRRSSNSGRPNRRDHVECSLWSNSCDNSSDRYLAFPVCVLPSCSSCRSNWHRMPVCLVMLTVNRPKPVRRPQHLAAHHRPSQTSPAPLSCANADTVSHCMWSSRNWLPFSALPSASMDNGRRWKSNGTISTGRCTNSHSIPNRLLDSQWYTILLRCFHCPPPPHRLASAQSDSNRIR